MKKLIFLFAITFAALISSCSDEKLDDSIFNVSERNRSDFDKWLLSNYAYPYNIDFKYKMEDIESDRSYTLVPAELDKAIIMAKLVKYLWLEIYDEIAGIEFTRTYIPKVIHLIGSPAYNANGSQTIGTAEGGLKVTLYNVNNLRFDPAYLNQWYFKTMHHEFAHILHQTKKFDATFHTISDADYIGSTWVNMSNATAYQNGFVSPYSMSSSNEDFVELFAVFVTNTPAFWANILSQAGATGSAIINRKFEIVSSYMRVVWDIDIYELRDIVQQRSAEVSLIDFDTL